MGQAADKLDSRDLWTQFDQNNSGVLDEAAIGRLLQSLWRHYSISKPLSAELVARVVAELDVNEDGRIQQAEFEDAYEELWDELAQQLQPSPAGEAAAPAPPAPGARPEPELDFLRCPHCGLEIDPRALDAMRVPPEALRRPPGPWEHLARERAAAAGAAALGAPPLPPGAQASGPVPASFFRSPHGWWAQQPPSQLLESPGQQYPQADSLVDSSSMPFRR
mmetsp:Transcript_27703/g.79863  ORF Transcript_27703/g.79863 Transcript_27703/m.79863 type:complete len:221 (+) Transcript_27703:159-821(+)